jgi:hypothetical protein
MKATYIWQMINQVGRYLPWFRWCWRCIYMAIVLAAQEALVLAVQRAESPFCLLACGFVVYL